MKYLSIISLLFLLSCGRTEYNHTVQSLIGSWQLDRIEVRTNTGIETINTCVTGRFQSVPYMDLTFQDETTVVFTLPCSKIQFVGYWVLNGSLTLVSGGPTTGEILYAESNVLIVKFDFTYNPVYYYIKK